MEFSRREYWSGLSFPSPWDLPNPGIEPGSPALQADSLPTELSGKPVISNKALKKFPLRACFPGGSVVKNPPANAEVGLIPGQ